MLKIIIQKLGKYLEDTSDYPYTTAISKIDEKNLKQIADDIGIDYIHMDRQSNIDKKLEDLKSDKFISSDEKTNSYVDIYYIFVIPLLLLFIFEFINYKRKL